MDIFIPKGTVDNNLLGADLLAGPKALDPNYCRQPNLLRTHDPCLCVNMNCAVFLAKAFPYS